MITLLISLFFVVSTHTLAATEPPSVEVLHWWTSGSEAKALKVIRDAFEKKGGKWTDVPVAGGAGQAARSVLKSRFVAGNPPSAALMHMGPQAWEWATEEALVDLSDIANSKGWSGLLPAPILDGIRHQGKFVVAPVSVHRVSYLFANPAVLTKAGVKAPKTWEEFNQAAESLQKKGILPLAHGGQPWQDVVLFEDVALGIGGADFYRKALLQQNPEALGGPVMTKIFDQMRRLKGFVDKGSPGRDWNLATAMVTRGEAAFQLQGDWAKGEFLGAGKKAEKDFLCIPSPGSQDSFSVNNDSFVFFRTIREAHQRGQKLLADVILSEEVQKGFALEKGAIPVRIGVGGAAFDACARSSMQDFAKAVKKGTIVQSFSSGGVPAAIHGAIADVVTAHFNSDMSSPEAIRRLLLAVKSVR